MTTYLVEDMPINQSRRRWRVFPAHTEQLLFYRLYHPKQILEMDGNEEKYNAGSMRVMDKGMVLDEMLFACHPIVDSSDASINATINSRTDPGLIVGKDPGPASIPSVAAVTDGRPSRNRRLPGHLHDYDIGSP